MARDHQAGRRRTRALAVPAQKDVDRQKANYRNPHFGHGTGRVLRTQRRRLVR
ncbi:hypothetical protein ABZT02_24395 [Streptomyces sp. NPDC005402]|uniref:hypothetical protein n=1 Tax=Streptomyces sp. NPDC005402 TaxID=3155338 RepID=UPI0033B2FF50